SGTDAGVDQISRGNHDHTVDEIASVVFAAGDHLNFNLLLHERSQWIDGCWINCRAADPSHLDGTLSDHDAHGRTFVTEHGEVDSLAAQEGVTRRSAQGH